MEVTVDMSKAKYAALARGDGDVYLRLPRFEILLSSSIVASSSLNNRPGKRYEEKIWDHAAGVAVIQEAGGTVSEATVPMSDKMCRSRTCLASHSTFELVGP